MRAIASYLVSAIHVYLFNGFLISNPARKKYYIIKLFYLCN